MNNDGGLPPVGRPTESGVEMHQIFKANLIFFFERRCSLRKPQTRVLRDSSFFSRSFLGIRKFQYIFLRTD